MMADAPVMDERRSAIIDIGSNSVRLVVFAGPARAPRPIFNEKLMIGLGASLVTSGRLDEPAYSRALDGVARFAALVDAMGISDVRCVATAAVRDAANGDAFIADAARRGVTVELLSGRDEARASGLGVISAIPDADGIVADLGGGSLELVRVSGGTTRHHSSFPFGVLRLPAMQAQLGKGMGRSIRKALADAGWPGDDAGLPLYLVGGSWRAIARLDMHFARDPMPVIAGHAIEVERALGLQRRVAGTATADVARIAKVPSSRVATLPAAFALLRPLTRQLGTNGLIVSTSGLREGLLFDRLDAATRALDPLIAAAAAEGRRFNRFGLIGESVAQWIAPLFADDAPADARLRHAAALLSDVASTANPDFRPERAAEMALHGQWLGIDADGRRILAQTLFSASGGSGRAVDGPTSPALDARLVRAHHWGLAMRLAMRLSAGVPALLEQTRLEKGKGALRLTLTPATQPLAGEQVERRLRQLGDALGLAARVKSD